LKPRIAQTETKEKRREIRSPGFFSPLLFFSSSFSFLRDSKRLEAGNIYAFVPEEKLFEEAGFREY
jgi:hypothetical protein